MEEQKIGFTGVWIPAVICLDHSLSDLEQKIFGLVRGFNDAGKEFFGSNAYIANLFGRGNKTVSTAISKLTASGKLISTIDHDNGNRRVLNAAHFGLSPKTAIAIPENGYTLSLKTATIYNKDSKDISSSVATAPIASKKEEYTEEFENFWKAYSNGKGKFYSAKCYATARKTVGADVLLAGAVRYRKEIVAARKEEYQKQASTWLNQHCWEDAPVTAIQKPVAPTKFSNPTLDSFLKNASKEVKNEFWSNKDKWMTYLKSSGCSAFELNDKITNHLTLTQLTA